MVRKIQLRSMDYIGDKNDNIESRFTSLIEKESKEGRYLVSWNMSESPIIHTRHSASYGSSLDIESVGIHYTIVAIFASGITMGHNIKKKMMEPAAIIHAALDV